MSRHIIVVLDGVSGAVFDSDLPLCDYHRTEDCDYESRRDNPEKLLVANDSPIVSDLIRTCNHKRDVSAHIHFSKYVCEVEVTSRDWSSEQLLALIKEQIARICPDAVIDVFQL
jgi:hypothetical protein